MRNLWISVDAPGHVLILYDFDLQQADERSYRELVDTLSGLPGVESVAPGRYRIGLTIATHVVKEADLVHRVFEWVVELRNGWDVGVVTVHSAR